MTGIAPSLEGRYARPADGIKKPFAVLSQADIGLNDLFDSVDDLCRAQSRSQHFADRRIFGTRTAQLNLVEFDALLVDTQNADMAGVVVTAGIDVTGYLDLDLAQIVLPFEIGEALLNGLRDRNGACVREIAIVETRAAD